MFFSYTLFKYNVYMKNSKSSESIVVTATA